MKRQIAHSGDPANSNSLSRSLIRVAMSARAAAACGIGRCAASMHEHGLYALSGLTKALGESIRDHRYDPVCYRLDREAVIKAVLSLTVPGRYDCDDPEVYDLRAWLIDEGEQMDFAVYTSRIRSRLGRPIEIAISTMEGFADPITGYRENVVFAYVVGRWQAGDDEVTTVEGTIRTAA